MLLLSLYRKINSKARIKNKLLFVTIFPSFVYARMVANKLETSGTVAKTAGFQAAEAAGVALSVGGGGLALPSSGGLAVGGGVPVASGTQFAIVV